MHAAPPPPMPGLVVRLPAGAARRTVYVRRPAGVVLLTRVVVVRGARVSVAATIPGVAGVGVSTGGAFPDRCRTAGATTVCTRDQEWCPMPAARWRVTFAKGAGPAGPVRLLFRVGRPPGAS